MKHRNDHDHAAAVSRAIDALLDYAARYLDLEPADRDYTCNMLLDLLGFNQYRIVPTTGTGTTEVCTADTGGMPDDLMAQTLQAVRDAGLCAGLDNAALADAIMNTLSARPSRIQRIFENLCQERGSATAMRWLYAYGLHNGYIHGRQLARNPRFEEDGLVITINTAKPEFKTMAAAAAGTSVQSGYPECTICHANEGFGGRDKRTLRIIPVTLGGEPWFWQFSPYGYFREHGICVNARHTPMHVDRATFGRLCDFTDRFPSYFLGCNAALPRIGGSVLAHDHYQGGGEPMPMHRASAVRSRPAAQAPEVMVDIIDWPGTVIRLRSRSREALVEVADRIRVAWEHYDNAAYGIASHNGRGERQSAVSPTVVKTGAGGRGGEVREPAYELSLILRNNAVSREHPEGVFHAHEEFWPIKHEPIGLIEAQGLFVLPGRLTRQLAGVRRALCEGAALPEELREFTMIYDETQVRLGVAHGSHIPCDAGAVDKALRGELASICRRILRNTAVFPNTHATQAFLAEAGV